MPNKSAEKRRQANKENDCAGPPRKKAKAPAKPHSKIMDAYLMVLHQTEQQYQSLNRMLDKRAEVARLELDLEMLRKSREDKAREDEFMRNLDPLLR